MDYIKIQNNIISIDGPIGQGLFNNNNYTINDFKKDVKNIKGKIVVEISSLGGDLATALSVYDFLRSIDNKVITKITSTSASAATIIALAGDRRYISANSRMLIHLPEIMMMKYINSDEMEQVLNEMKELDKQLINLYVSRSNLSHEQVMKLMRDERFIDAEKAIEYGFVDDIIKDKIDLEKEINNNMDDKIFALLKATNEDDAYVSIINLLDENTKLKDMISTSQSKGDASQVANEVDEKEEEDEKVEAQAETETDEKETDEKEAVEKETETDEAQAETDDEKETDENESVENETDDEKEKLLARITELENMLAEYEKEKEDMKNAEIKNYLDEQIQSKIITADIYDNWRDVANDKGLDFVKNMISNLPIKKEKISNFIGNDFSNLSQKEIKDMWKSGKIDGDTYQKLKK